MNIKRLTSILVALVCSTVSSLPANEETLVFDTFDIGPGTRNDDVEDINDVQWFELWTNAAVGTSTDNGGIGQGNALYVDSTSPLQTLTSAPLPATVELNSIGDKLTMSFDFRLPMVNTTGFRYGLHDQGETVMTNDDDAYFQAADDNGYHTTLTLGGGDIGIGGIGRELDDVDYLSNTAGDDFSFPGILFEYFVLGTVPHSTSLHVERLSNGIGISVFVDKDLVGQTVDDTEQSLTRFNSMGISSFNNDFLVDNVRIEFDEKISGDVNGDGFVDLLDVQPFVDMISQGGYSCEADVNNDGELNLLDVSHFVVLLSGG